MAIRLRRGPSSQRTTFTPEQAEVLYDTDTKNVWIGDNTTPGGTFVGGPDVVNSVLDSANIDLDITSNVLTADLTTTGVIANTYGGATLIPQLTVDAYGRITGVTNVSVSIPPSISLETNGTPNSVQNLLDLVAGTNVTLTESSGSVTIDASGGISHGTAAGTDTYTVTITGVTGYADGDAYLIRFTNGNTTVSTLDINSLGAIPLYRNNDGQLIGGDIWDGAEMLCVYNSTANNFQCIGTSPNSIFAYVTNADSVTITKGEPVYAYGGTGDRMTVKLAYNTSDATSARTAGFVYSTSIAAGQKGIIITEGLIDGLSNVKPINGWADGDIVYLGATAGTITRTKPYAPNHLVYLGVVTTASAGSAGRIYVKVQNGYELDELHNVSAQTPSNNDGIFYNTVTSLWETKSITTVLGYTPVPNSRTISTSTPLSGGGDLTANRTISIANAQADGSTKGAAAFNASDFNDNGSGIISIDYTNGQAASSSNKGFLTSTDWSTFNNKQPAGSYITALTGDVTASGPGSVAATLKSSYKTAQLFIELNGLGGVIQAPSYTGVSNITCDGTITGWTIFSMNPSTGLALSGSVDVDIWVGNAGVVPVVGGTLFPVAGNRPQLVSASYNSATGLSIAVTAGQTIMAKVVSATTCVLVNLQLQITRS